MKAKKAVALFLALLMTVSLSFNSLPAFAEDAQVNNVEGKTVTDKETVGAPAGQEQGKVAPEATNGPAAEPMRTPGAEKTFTVTKRTMGSNDEGELVGKYETLYDAMENCKQEDLSNEYVITLNKDYDIPEGEGAYSKSSINILLKSAEDKTCTLKRLGTRVVFYVSDDCKMRTENIIFDGNNDGELTLLSENGELTLGKGTVVQNFIDVPTAPGSAIYLTESSTLNIEDGAIVRNNKGNKNGGIIGADTKDNTINISGGLFQSNKCETFGGVIATWGNLNVTGGTFEKNSAPYGGAITVFKTAQTTISNAKFKENESQQGSGILSYNDIHVVNTTFENNEANWGGAIFARKAVDLNKVTFKDNQAAKQGGAMYLSSGDSTITDSNFTNNQAGSGGGGLFIAHDNKGTTAIEKSSFTENKSNAFGGSIYVGMNSKLEVKGSAFEKNVATYGAGISSAGSGAVDMELTGIKVEESSFTDNESLMGAGIYTAFPTEVLKSTFTRNAAHVHPQDDQTNPHVSGVGGAMEIIDNKTVIKGSTFEENVAYGSGGAIGINGVSRDEEKDVTSLKENLKVEISENTQFIGNTCDIGQGGAIFTIPYLYDIEGYESEISQEDLKEKAYTNLTTTADTVFKDNVAVDGFVNPPTDYAKYSNLQFSRNSFTDALPGQDVSKSLLNNYDVNYKNDMLSAYFDPNGGAFTDSNNKNPTDIKVITGKKDGKITILPAPQRECYKFLGWKGTRSISEDKLKALPDELREHLLAQEKNYQPGEKFKLESNFIFTAQWEKVEKPEPKHRRGGGGDSVLNKEDHYQYLIGYEDDTFKPENNMTREEVAVMFSRLLKNPPVKGQVYAYSFPDVDQSRWSVTAISYMNKLGIVKGYPDGDFKPEASITRAEFAAMAAGFADLQEGDKTFSDLDSSHWAYDVVRKAASAGWISGYPDGTFKADNPITRAEVVTITNKMLNRQADQDFVDRNLDKLLSFIDLNKAYWAYYPIMEATNGHDYIRSTNKVDEKWQEVTNKSFVYDK